jgi:cell division inhibitor SepF
MSTLWQKTLLYLGLVDEDEFDESAPSGSPNAGTGMPQRQIPQAQPRPAQPRPAQPVEAPRQPQARAPQPAPPAEVDPRAGRRVEPPPPTKRRVSTEQSIQTDSGVVLRPSDYPGASSSHAEIIAAHSFADAKRLADLVRERVPVLVNLRDTEPDMVRRIVDFASGLIYALDGTMRKVSEGVILVSPPRITLSADEERRLMDLGLFDER